MKPFLPLSDKTRAEMEGTYPFFSAVKDSVLSALLKMDKGERTRIIFSALRKTESSVSAELSRLRSRPNRATKFSIVMKRTLTILKLALDTLPEDAQVLAYPTLALISTHFVNIILPSSLKTTSLPKFVACHLYAFLKSAFSNDLEFVLDILVCSNVFEDAESDLTDNHSMGFYILVEAMLDGYLYAHDTPAFAKYLTVLSFIHEITNGGDEALQRTLRDLEAQNVFNTKDVVAHFETNFGMNVASKKSQKKRDFGGAPTWKEIIKRIKPRKIASVTRQQRLTVISGGRSGLLKKKERTFEDLFQSQNDSSDENFPSSYQSSRQSQSQEVGHNSLFFMDRGGGESHVSSSQQKSPEASSPTLVADHDPYNLLPPFSDDEEEELLEELDIRRKPSSPRKNQNRSFISDEEEEEIQQIETLKKPSSPRKKISFFDEKELEKTEMRRKSSPRKRLSFFDEDQLQETEIPKKPSSPRKSRLPSVTSSTEDEDKLPKLSPRKSFIDSSEYEEEEDNNVRKSPPKKKAYESDSDESDELQVLFEERATPKKHQLPSDSEDDGIDSDEESRDFAPAESGEDEIPEYSEADYGFVNNSAHDSTATTIDAEDCDATDGNLDVSQSQEETQEMEVDSGPSFLKNSNNKRGQRKGRSSNSGDDVDAKKEEVSTSSSPTRRNLRQSAAAAEDSNSSDAKSPTKRKTSLKTEVSSPSPAKKSREPPTPPKTSPSKNNNIAPPDPKSSVILLSPRRLRTRSNSGSTTGTITPPIKANSKKVRQKKDLSPLKEEQVNPSTSPKNSSPSPTPTKRVGRKSTTVAVTPKGRTGRGRKSVAAAKEAAEDTKKLTRSAQKHAEPELTPTSTKKKSPPKKGVKKEVTPNIRTTRSTRARAAKTAK